MSDPGKTAGGAAVHLVHPIPAAEAAGEEEAEEAREARIRELREQVARGEYRVDPYEVARSILRHGL